MELQKTGGFLKFLEENRKFFKAYGLL